MKEGIVGKRAVECTTTRVPTQTRRVLELGAEGRSQTNKALPALTGRGHTLSPTKCDSRPQRPQRTHYALLSMAIIPIQ